MAARGRPWRTPRPTVVNVKLLLYSGEDDDLLAFFAALPARQRASAVKSALRGGQLIGATLPAGPDDDALADLLSGLLFED